MDNATKEKKNKQTQFNHARDNAIAALGKIIKHQEANIDAATIIPGWFQLLPLKHDLEEAKINNEFLAEMLFKRHQVILGANNERLEHMVQVLGEICTPKQSNEDTLDSLKVLIAEFSNGNLREAFTELC
jgi:hypothetical protein